MGATPVCAQRTCVLDLHCDRAFEQIPIMMFLDENCIIFDQEEENKLEYTEIHNVCGNGAACVACTHAQCHGGCTPPSVSSN